MNVQKSIYVIALIIISVTISLFCCKKDDYDFYSFVDSYRVSINKDEFQIDFAEIDCEWDTLCYYSEKVPVNYINEKHGTCFKDKISVKSRVVVLHKNRVVSTQEYDWECSGIYPTFIFCLGNRAVITKDNAKFKVNRLGKEYYIEKIE